MKDLNTNGIFLEALRYPEKARAEFYLKKQIESGWSKSVFFSALQESYHYWQLYLKVNRIKGTAFKDANSLPFANPIPGGPNELTIELLNDLLRSVKEAINWDKPKREYSGIRVISMIQFSIGFIYNQFMMQANKREWNHMVYSFPKEYKKGMYLFNTYAIGGDQIFFDFNRFADEVRLLYCNSSNSKAVERMLKPTWELASKNVDLWNDEIYPISYDLYSNPNPLRKVIKGHQILNIDPDTFVLSHPYNHREFVRRPHKSYQNQNFAVFSEDVANFLYQNIFCQEGYKGEGSGLLENSVDRTIVNKVKFSSDKIDEIFERLHDCFEDAQKQMLLELLKGNNINGIKLLFLSNSNRFVNAFKQFKEKGYIVSGTKQDLIEWIYSNFMYLNKNKATEFSKKSISNYITDSKILHVKNPLFRL